MKIKDLHNPVGNHLIYVFCYEFRCRLHNFQTIGISVTFTYEKKVVIGRNYEVRK
jgi:hypothetical protein